MDDVDWITLIQRLGPKLYRFFLANDSKAQAEDSVQEVFIRLLEKLDSSYKNGLGSVEAYTWGIAINLRKERAREVRSRERLLSPDHLMDIADPSDLEQSLASNLATLKKAVGDLDEPEKTILQLVLADMQILEIGRVLEMPEGTVKSHIHRAKDNLREKMKKWGFYE